MKVKTAIELMPNAEYELPYESEKEMLWVKKGASLYAILIVSVLLGIGHIL